MAKYRVIPKSLIVTPGYSADLKVDNFTPKSTFGIGENVHLHIESQAERKNAGGTWFEWGTTYIAIDKDTGKEITRDRRSHAFVSSARDDFILDCGAVQAEGKITVKVNVQADG